jgi:mono/diheme cytochrome c family protein/uncharacterized cupredoxin-like copper-binding protein
MTDETPGRPGRELVPRPDEAPVVTPREGVPVAPPPEERFYGGERAHTVGLDEQRSAQIVRSTGNARYVAFLAVLIVALFIPVYWIYDIGVPPLGISGRLAAEERAQYITDVSRGYALFLANCARCHGNQGQGGIGPPLNDQGKLYNTLTADGLSGPGHLNPDYIRAVLTEGGRYVCGDPASVMPAWLQPKGPLNYREVEEIITFILASTNDVFYYQPAHAELGATLPPPAREQGWRDPNYTPPPDATPVPACWRAPSGGGGSATPAPVTSPGTAQNPRVIALEGTADLHWVDPATGQPVTQISLVAGETVEFHITLANGAFHNFHIGSMGDLEAAPQDTNLPGLPAMAGPADETFTYTVGQLPDQPQFACTVPGHYPTMNGNLVIVPSGPAGPGGPGGATPAPASPGASPAPSASP